MFFLFETEDQYYIPEGKILIYNLTTNEETYINLNETGWSGYGSPQAIAFSEENDLFYLSFQPTYNPSACLVCFLNYLLFC